MKKLIVVIATLLSLSGLSSAQSLFFGGTGNVSPALSGNVFAGIDFKIGNVTATWYGGDVLSIDAAYYVENMAFVASIGGATSTRENDFISLLVAPKILSFGKNNKWKLFGKVGVNADIGPIPEIELKNRFAPIFGFGLRYR